MKRYRNNPFAVRLFKALEKSGMMQKEFADRIGVTQTSVSRYLSGDRIPKADLVASMAKALEVSCDYLCGMDGAE